ncbi:MAG: LysM peptidoglycan-binding domain-containing protein [Planctomycetota bacterium]
MAQETKVGLVVGLGFIICFAIILANRSGADRIHPQMPYQLFGRPAPPSRGPNGSPTEARAREGNRPRQSRPADDSAVSPAGPGSGPRPSATAPRDGVDPEPAVQEDPERFTRRRRPIPKPLDPSEPVLASAPANGEGGRGLPAAETSPTEPAPDAAAAASLGLPPALAPYADQLEPVRRGEAATPKAQVQRVVENGDTLNKIARRCYGASSTKIVNALYEANRSVLSSPDAVVVGRTLELPVVEGIAPKLAAPAGDTRNAVADATEPVRGGKPAFRWYKVRKGDRLGTIAQKQLGSAIRWQEILALNQDICSDARYLPSGVEIRIPTNTLADAR